VIVAAALGIVVVSALWWLYFDVAAIFARRQLVQASGVEQRASRGFARVRTSREAWIKAAGLEIETRAPRFLPERQGRRALVGPGVPADGGHCDDMGRRRMSWLVARGSPESNTSPSQN
jgi:hypothetical protein